MTNSDEWRPAADEVSPGVPATEDVPEPSFRTGQWGGGEEEVPMPDEPMAVDDYGTTPAEQARPEPLADRVAREEPDVDQPDVSAEEAAMRVVDEGSAPGVTDDASPDYVGDEPPGSYRSDSPS